MTADERCGESVWIRTLTGIQRTGRCPRKKGERTLPIYNKMKRYAIEV
jgi:hypothetical protein